MHKNNCNFIRLAINTLMPLGSCGKRRTERKLSQDPEACECSSPRPSPGGTTGSMEEEEEEL